ncbi:hypothetical protein, partial [Mesorhizobium abyssinicae]|uniref:hypothetical protein n=1 Tax=Mesorhizobium abyssinicae TaxID=1209958 RepID=UPI003CE9B4C0
SYDQSQLWQEVDQAERREPAGSGSNWSPQIPSDFDATMWPTPESASTRSSGIYRGLDSIARSRSVSEDNQVIEDACRAAASRYGKDTLKVYRSTLGRFNSWLSQTFGKGIAQMEPAVLSRAVDEYKKNVGPG